MKKNLKIAVIGAGAWGGWTAYFLRKLGAQVTLVDMWGPGHSRSGSGGETRVIRATYGADEIYSRMVFRSMELLDKFGRDWQTKLIHKAGAIWMFQNNPTYGEQSQRVLQQYDYQFEAMELAEAKKRFPQINLSDIKYTFYEADAGFIEARRLCQLVCEKYQQEGGHYLTASAKLGDAPDDRLLNVKTADGQCIEADQFVFACGLWNKDMFPDLFQTRSYLSRQEVYYFDVSREAPLFSSPAMPIWLDFDDDEILHYGVPDHHYRGFKIAYDRRQTLEEYDTAANNRFYNDHAPDPEILARSKAFVARRFPRLKSAPIAETRICHYENSLDGHFIIDRHPILKNVLVAGGSSGHGFKMGSAIGEHLAHHLTDNKPLEPFFSFRRLDNVRRKASQFFDK